MNNLANDNNISVGQNIRYFRKIKKIKLKDLSKMIDISGSFLSKMENDKVKLKYKTLKNISKALEIDISCFFDSLKTNINKKLKGIDFSGNIIQKNEAQIGKNVRYIRMVYCLRAQNFAKMLGISGSYLSKIETNQVDLYVYLLFRMSKALEIPIKTFLEALESDDIENKAITNYSSDETKNSDAVRTFQLDNKTVGSNIRYFRRLNNISAQDFAKMLGISGSYFSKIENNDCAISNSEIKKIANHLNVNIRHFYCALKTNRNVVNTLLSKENQNFQRNTIITNDNTCLTVGQNIKYFRQIKYYKSIDLANAIGTSIGAISKYESNKSDIKVPTLLKISQIFNVHISRFFYDVKDNIDELSNAFAKNVI